jgi:sulfur relay (sulfurtransferase) DsrC/TusE family protein
MEDSIFLSASVPDPKRAPEFAETSNSVAITSAVRALVHVTLGRRVLVWGGHPAITPMIKVVAEEMGLEYGEWVKLYQSLYFKDQFPQDNEKFGNVVYTENIENDRDKSLRHMREQMFSENNFRAAIFVGGMAGIIDEFEIFAQLQPGKDIIPVLSTGGATLKIAEKINAELGDDLLNDLDYVRLFHKKLEVSAREDRFLSPDVQPKDIEKRYWRPD